jgi:hypothetical protein
MVTFPGYSVAIGDIVPIINYPSTCDAHAIFDFCDEIEQYCDEDEVIINFIKI